MTQLAIHNPATGAVITRVEADDASSVAAKAAAARAAQAESPITITAVITANEGRSSCSGR